MPVLPATTIDAVLLGTTEADTLDGGSTNDLIYAGAGDDTITGRGGADVIFGNRGADVVAAGPGADVVVWTNGDGSDAVDGGSGFDTQVVEGNPAAGERFTLGEDGGNALFERVGTGPFQLDLDRVEALDLQSLGGDDRFTVEDLSGTDITQIRFRGGDGADRLEAQGSDTPIVAEGENGADRLVGGSGDDQLHGGNGGDTLRGSGGDDWLIGGNGADTLNGGQGRDVLEGGAGDDNLTGGGGGDAFVVEPSQGDDTIFDFQAGTDLIVLRDFGPPGGPAPTFADLDITLDGDDSVVDLSAFGDPASLRVVGEETLAAEDFAFL